MLFAVSEKSILFFSTYYGHLLLNKPRKKELDILGIELANESSFDSNALTQVATGVGFVADYNGYNDVQSCKAFDTRDIFWVLLQAMFMNDENKQHGQAIKIARETTNNQKKKYNSVRHLQRQQFSFTKTSTEVSLKILSL